MKVWKKSVRWHVSRLPGLHVDRLIEALSEEPFHIFLSEHYDLQTIQRPYLFFVVWIELFEENPRKFHFHRYQPRLLPALLLPHDMAENFPRFLLLCFLSIRSCFFNVTAAIVKVFRSPGSRGPRSDLVLVPWSRVGWGHFPVSVKLFIQLPRSKSLLTVPWTRKRIIVLSLEPIS